MRTETHVYYRFVRADRDAAFEFGGTISTWRNYIRNMLIRHGFNLGLPIELVRGPTDVVCSQEIAA